MKCHVQGFFREVENLSQTYAGMHADWSVSTSLMPPKKMYTCKAPLAIYMHSVSLVQPWFEDTLKHHQMSLEGVTKLTKII